MSLGPACRHTHAHISYFPSLFIRIAVGRGPLFESPWLLYHNRRAWWPIACSAFPRSLRLPFLIRGCSLFSATPFPTPVRRNLPERFLAPRSFRDSSNFSSRVDRLFRSRPSRDAIRATDKRMGNNRREISSRSSSSSSSPPLLIILLSRVKSRYVGSTGQNGHTRRVGIVREGMPCERSNTDDRVAEGRESVAEVSRIFCSLPGAEVL